MNKKLKLSLCCLSVLIMLILTIPAESAADHKGVSPDTGGVNHVIEVPLPGSEDIYLIVRRDNRPISPKPEWGEVLFQKNNSALIRISELLPFFELYSEYLMIPLDDREAALIYRDEEEETGYLHYDPEVLSDQTIFDMVSTLHPDSLEARIASLEDFQTRFFLHPNRYEIISWLAEEFYSYGFSDVVIDSFFVDQYAWGHFPPVWQSNVIATIPGSTHPENVLLIGAHYDSIIFPQFGDPMEIAPGADDNASGVAALLEIARVVKMYNYQPSRTWKFVAFGAEEIGLKGSIHYAQQLAAGDRQVEIMLNNDMIAYTPPGDDDWKAYLYPYRGFVYLADLAEEIFAAHTAIEPVRGFLNNPASDSFPFYQNGIPSLFLHEYHFNPYYHSPDDLLINCNVDYALEMTRASMLTLLYLDRIPVPVRDYELADTGDGTGIVALWSYPEPEEISHYHVYFGTSAGEYEEIGTTEGTSFLISGLEEGETYYVGVSARSNAGFEGLISKISKETSSVPQTPQEFSISAYRNHVKLTWRPNTELDLAGYNIYRSRMPGDLEPELYAEIHPEAFFIDYDLEDLVYYYYSVSAVDNDGNESIPTDQLKTRLFSLSQGILVLNLTPDENDDYLMPDAGELFRYYDFLLSNYRVSHMELPVLEKLSVLDIAPYSTTILFNDSILSPEYKPNLSTVFSEYLEKEGNLLTAGFNPLYHFTGDKKYPQEFEEGSFVYEYLGISSALHSVGSLFRAAEPAIPGYPRIETDPAKVPAAIEHHLINVIGFTAIPEDYGIYSYSSEYPAGTPAGAMQGLFVGVENRSHLSAVTLSYPLFYMNYEQASDLIDHIMLTVFLEEPWQPDDEPDRIRPVYLLPNYPNPFRRETVIPWFLEEGGEISIVIYNIKGQQVRNLYTGYSDRGRSKLIWDGRDDKNRQVASGIYLCTIRQDSRQSSGKILYLR